MTKHVEKLLKKNMAIEQSSKDNSPLKKEFQSLLDQDFKDRKLKENEIISNCYWDY